MFQKDHAGGCGQSLPLKDLKKRLVKRAVVSIEINSGYLGADLSTWFFQVWKDLLLSWCPTCTAPGTGSTSPVAGENTLLVLPESLKKHVQKIPDPSGGQGTLTEGLMALSILQTCLGTSDLALVCL